MRLYKIIVCSICIYLLRTQVAYSQAFVYTIDGKMFYTEAKNLNKDRISVEIDRNITKSIPKTDIVLIEYLEDDGMEILQKDKIIPVEPPNIMVIFHHLLLKERRSISQSQAHQ